jgi:tetratricopeptide (TPR) repeat protein
VFAGAALAVAVGAAGVRWLVRAEDERKVAGFLLLWWIVAMLPAVVYPLHVLFQEHRDYLPWMGLAGAAGVAAATMWDRMGRRPTTRHALLGVGLVVYAICAAATVARNGVWTDELRLWTDAAEKSPAHPAVRLNLGTEYAKRGDSARALAEYQEAIRRQPDYGLAHHNVGLLHLGRGEYVQARAALEQAAALTPDAPEPLAALGTVYEKLGDAARSEAAFAAAGAAVERRPHPPTVRLAVADALAKSARPREAAAHYQAVLAQEQAQPSFISAKAYLGLGYIAEREGRPDEALQVYAKALEIDPRLDDALFNSANVLLATGRYPEATVAYERVLANTPSFFPARFNLGRLYEREGRRGEAQREYQAFLRDAPTGPAYASARRYAASRVGADGQSDEPPGQTP